MAFPPGWAARSDGSGGDIYIIPQSLRPGACFWVFFSALHQSPGILNTRSEHSCPALFESEVYGSFAPLRMTRIRFVVILSSAKDLYISPPDNVWMIPRHSVTNQKKHPGFDVIAVRVHLMISALYRFVCIPAPALAAAGAMLSAISGGPVRPGWR